MSHKIQEGYAWLARNCHEEDQIFIFGFSRGAFTAMGLVGLLAWAGLPENKSIVNPEVEELFDEYRAATLQQADRISSADEASSARRSGFREVRIRFVGLFDTVRAAGLEVFNFRGLRAPGEVASEQRVSDPTTLALRYTRHLPSTVDRAYHALAIDEHRAVFHPRVWIVPKKRERDPEEVEQRWFVGAHANVGGGYPNDRLPLIPSRWMQAKAEDAGAAFSLNASVLQSLGRMHKLKSLCLKWLRGVIPPRRTSALLPGQVRDSYREWLCGLYPLLSWKEYHRPIHAGGLSFADSKGEICYEAQTIDPSVLDRVDAGDYSPPNLMQFLVRWLPSGTKDRLAETAPSTWA
jgi:hypothetical protein